MFILFGAKSRAKVVEGGRRGQRRCDDCEKRTDWVECLVKDSFNVFFVDVLESAARCMRCCECGEDMAIDEWDAEQRRALPRETAPAAASTATRAAPAQKAPVDYDKEFAALKARLGKK